MDSLVRELAGVYTFIEEQSEKNNSDYEWVELREKMSEIFGGPLAKTKRRMKRLEKIAARRRSSRPSARPSARPQPASARSTQSRKRTVVEKTLKNNGYYEELALRHIKTSRVAPETNETTTAQETKRFNIRI